MSDWHKTVAEARVNSISAVGASDDTATLIEIKKLRLDGGTQPRVQVFNWNVSEYVQEMERGVVFPAVTAFFDGTEYWLADGFHRVEAAKKIGKTEITVDVRQGTRRDAVLFSVSANTTHGLRRCNADKRRGVLVLLNDSEWSRWSNREIARCCQVSPDLVDRLRTSLPESGSESTRQFVTKHGTKSVMNVANIGSRSAYPFDDDEDLALAEEEPGEQPVLRTAVKEETLPVIAEPEAPLSEEAQLESFEEYQALALYVAAKMMDHPDRNQKRDAWLLEYSDMIKKSVNANPSKSPRKVVKRHKKMANHICAENRAKLSLEERAELDQKMFIQKLSIAKQNEQKSKCQETKKEKATRIANSGETLDKSKFTFPPGVG